MLELPKFRNVIFGLIERCKSVRELKQVHAVIISSPFLHTGDRHYLITRLIFLCALSDWHCLRYATRIFRSIKHPNLSIYNIMIRAFSGKLDNPSDTHQSLILYKKMLGDGVVPDGLTIPFVLRGCSKKFASGFGRGIHGQVVRFGWCRDVYVGNSMIGFYSACGLPSIALKVFGEMHQRDVVSWNSAIVACLKGGDLDGARGLFGQMGEKRNIITWNSMITGFVQGGRANEAVDLFNQMLVLKVEPDKFSLAGVISACASLGALDHGKRFHGYLKRIGLDCDVVLETALIDMYGKCGCVEGAYEIFTGMRHRDSLAYTAMISVFALHGYANEAFHVFSEMEARQVTPNAVTFVGLLSACAHSGMTDKGWWYFKRMASYHSIEPQVYHYACMVDILSRAGRLEEAEELIRTMPMEPDAYVLGALLGGCQMHGNVELGERAAGYLIELDPSNHAFYMNLCDLYGKAGRYGDMRRIRDFIKERGVKKEAPGCSMVEVDGVIHEFSVRGSSEISTEDLIEVLNGLRDVMKGVDLMSRIDGEI